MRLRETGKYLMAVFCSWAAILFLAEMSFCFQTVLTVDERAGVSRTETPLTAGVPFPRGLIYSDQEVQIAGVAGQFRTLSTWQDGSVKWLLCDFTADVSAHGTSTYYLTNGAGDASGTPLTATESAESIVVVTGPLKFVVSKTNFNLFQQLWLDLDEDGNFEAEEEMISPHAQDGATVTYDSGQQFCSALDGGVSVELEEVGPLRLAILAEGWHRNDSGQRGLDFTIRIHAYSGQSFLRVFYTFYNRQSAAIVDHIDVKDISLRSHINLQGSASYAFGGSGSTVHSGNLSGSESAYIYGYGTCTPGDLHYTIGGNGAGSGDKARGWADVSDSRWGLTTAIRQFWQLHPKGIEVGADGAVWVRMLPVYYDSFPINPDDPRTAADRIYCGAAKTHEILYYFHPGNRIDANSEAMALSFENPLFAVAPPQWYTSSEVFGKITPQDISLIKPEYRWIVQEWEDHVEYMYDVIFLNRENSGWSAKNEYGMWNYGDSWQGQWSNIHYDAPYPLYAQFARSADLKWFDLATDQVKHYRDVDIVYHMGDQPPGSYKEACVGAARGRPNENHNLGIDDQGYTALKGPGLILHYFLTGDRQSLYGGKMQADFVRNSAARYDADLVLYDPRMLGQGLQALLSYYEASGDETYLNNGVYQRGDMDGSLKVSAYTLAMKINEYQSISPMYPEIYNIWQNHGLYCDCDDGFRMKYQGSCIGSSWQSGNAWEALYRYYQITQDPTARDDVLRGIEWMVERANLWTDEYGGYFYGWEPPHPEPGGVSLAGQYVGVLGHAYGETGNIDYLNKAISALDVSIVYGQAITDVKLLAQKTRTVLQLFYYLSQEYGAQDTVPPNPPTNLQATDATERSISLAWTPPEPASDGDGASWYSIYRDSAPVSTSPGPQYEDSGLPENAAFDYAVYSVDNVGILSPTAATGTFSTLADNTPPTVSSVSLTDATSLEIVFSEPMEESSTEEISNYQIDNGVAVISANLHADLVTLQLTTSPHEEGLTYTIAINGVRDRAVVPNTIAPNSSYVYELYSQLLVSDIDPPDYQCEYLQVGDEYYIDRTLTVVSIPAELQNLLWIKTANDDKGQTSEGFLTFTVNQDVTAYVAYDSRASGLPFWITDHYTEMGAGIGVTDGASPLQVWARDVPAGSVVMGANMANGASGAGSMYVVLLRGQGSAADTTAPLISQVIAVGVSDSAATIQWITDEPADSRVEFGFAPGSYVWVVEDSLLVLSHSLELTGLTPDTQYHYRLGSQDVWGNASTSQDMTFTTAHELPGIPGQPIHFDD